MLAALLKAAVALVLMVSVFSATQLVAAWAVMSRRPLVWRLGVLIAGLYALWFAVLAITGPYYVVETMALFCLEMFKIALVLAIVKRVARRGFTFSLGGLLAVTAFCAVLLTSLRSIEINRYLPDLNMLALLSILSSITIAALWATLSPARPAQRAIALAVVLCTSTAMIRFNPYVDLSYMRPITAFLFVLLLLTTHALIVTKAARVWRMWETAAASSNRATTRSIDS